jgi:hypothetical protein
VPCPDRMRQGTGKWDTGQWLRQWAWRWPTPIADAVRSDTGARVQGWQWHTLFHTDCHLFAGHGSQKCKLLGDEEHVQKCKYRKCRVRGTRNTCNQAQCQREAGAASHALWMIAGPLAGQVESQLLVSAGSHNLSQEATAGREKIAYPWASKDEGRHGKAADRAHQPRSKAPGACTQRAAT